MAGRSLPSHDLTGPSTHSPVGISGSWRLPSRRVTAHQSTCDASLVPPYLNLPGKGAGYSTLSLNLTAALCFLIPTLWEAVCVCVCCAACCVAKPVCTCTCQACTVIVQFLSVGLPFNIAISCPGCLWQQQQQQRHSLMDEKKKNDVTMANSTTT